ncbi:hypothetical protein F2Q68_00000476, partial [Brassica cretica]
SKTKLWSSENPLRGVAPLLAAVHKVQVSTKRLTALHPDCLQLCLLAKCYKAGFSVLSDDDILEGNDMHWVEDIQESIGASLQFAFSQVVTAPMHVVNAIALEAYKKYILVTLIHSGQFSISLPKCASTTAKSSFKTWCTPYIDVGMRYNDGNISELEAVVVANSSDFEKDKNLGLVKQAVSSLYKRNILRLTQKYLTLSLQDIANMVQLANAKEAEMHVLQMVLYLLCPTLDFLKLALLLYLLCDNIEQYKTSEMIEIVDSVIQRTIGLSKNLIAMDESLSCDPLYLGKVGRERQRYDFGDDFDTVPQKFSIDDDILEVDQPRDFYLYCYYGGMICIGLKRFQKALELLYNCCHCSNACCQRHSSRGVQKVHTGDSHSLWTASILHEPDPWDVLANVGFTSYNLLQYPCSFGCSRFSASAAAAASMKTVVVRFADADADADAAAYYITTAGFIGVSRRTRRSDAAC